MATIREKEVYLNLIETLKEMPYIWNNSTDKYYNKHLRNEGYRVLLDIYKTIQPKATPKTLKKKLEHMRTSYFNELRKVQKAKQTDKIYEPTLWFYHAYHFMRREAVEDDCTIIKDREALMEDDCMILRDSNNREALMEDDCTILRDSEEASSVEEVIINEREYAENNNYMPHKKKSKHIKEKTPEKQINDQVIIEKADKSVQYDQTKDDDWDIIGKSISVQLQKLNNRQVIIAQKLISDVIYFGRLDRLTEESLVLPQPVNEFL
ncbi:uncharacterized protein LOC135083794 [Ostrinia nubilalis]|uniref:uncharacterized protein LOC135083794 n=1 Tax=Ostrinia nubilalis TaxID=29057 RepID=UPI003082483A